MTRTTFATSLTSPTCSIIASRHPVNALMLSTCLLLSGCGADNAGTGQVDSNNSILPFSMESISLEDESTGVVRAVAPRFAFTNEPDATAIAANVQLTHAHGSAALSFGVDKTHLTITPVYRLLPLTRYSLQVGADLADRFGQKLAAARTVTFTTADAQWMPPSTLTAPGTIVIGAAIARGPGASAMAVWADYEPPHGYLWSRHYTPAAGWQSPQQIPTDPVGAPHTLQMGLDAKGDGLAVWLQNDGARTNLWASRYTAAGGWAAAQQIEALDGSADHPQLVVQPDGSAVAVWSQWLGDRRDIWSNRFTPQGGWEGAQSIDSGTVGSAEAPRLAIDAHGRVVVVWARLNWPHWHVWSNRYEPESGWGTAAVLDAGHGPHVAMNADGGAVIVWVHHDGQYALRFRRSTPGAGWGPAATITTSDINVLTSAKAALDASGAATVVWAHGYDPQYRIWSSRISTANEWTAPAPIDANPSNEATAPVLVKDASGNALAVWNESEGGGDRTMWANRYTPAGGWSGARRIDTHSAGSAFGQALSMDPGGGVSALWLHFDNTVTIVTRSFD